MAYVITEPCIGTCDTACVKDCPVDCIWGPVSKEEILKVDPKERKTIFPGIQMFIDPDECICCGACVSVCPVSAIFDEDAVPEKWRSYIELNARFFESR